MENSLLILTVGLASVNWLAVDRGWKKTRIFSKPAALIALIAWFSLAAGWQAGNLWFGLALVFSLAGDILMLVRSGLVRANAGLKMVPPVAVYTLTICLMLISAWLCLFRPSWPLEAALLAGAGASLFVASDSFLAYMRFVGKLPHGDLIVMVTYLLGQIAITAGVILHA